MGMILMLFIVEVFSTMLQRIFCDSTLVKRKTNKYVELLVWGGYFAIFNIATYTFTNYVGAVWMNLLIFVLAFFVAVRILYTNSVRTLVAVTIFMYVSGMCAELLIYYGKEWLLESYEGDFTLLCTILSKLVWFLIIKLTSLVIKLNKKIELNIQDWLEVFIVPVGSIWVLLSIFITGTFENHFWGFIAVFMILMINIFTYYLYDKAKENMEKRIREELLEKQCAYYIRQNKESKEWWEELRKFQHNMKQHYIIENAYLEKKDYDALKRYCSENLVFLNKKGWVSNSGNIYIDSVVNYEAAVAEREGIELIANIEVPQDAEINAEDIGVCLGNLLDNAIEATKELLEDKIIRMWVKVDANNLLINIQNCYKNRICKKGDQYLSSKKNDGKHGLGLLIVRQIVEKYDGEIQIKDEHNIFDITILMYDFLKRNEKRA